MEDLLYILAIIAWVAYSFYKNSQKVKKQRPQVRPERQSEAPAPKEYPEVRDILKELLGDAIPEQAEPAPSPRSPQMAEAREDLGRAKGTAYETLETTYTWDDRYEEEGRMPAQEPEKVYDMASNRTFDPKDIEEVKEARRKGPGINLRKAVVLSEILHRPYDETAPSRALWEG